MPDYLTVLRLRQKALLQRRGSVPSDHPRSVTTTFLLAFEQIQLKNEAAIELLKLCAFLSPDAIPLELIIQSEAPLGTLLERVTADALRLDQALETLQAYSLVQRDAENHALSVHRLVQAVLLNSMTEQECNQWTQRAIMALDAVFPHSEHETWHICERLVSHALSCATYTQSWQNASLNLASLLYKTANYLFDRARYEQAEPLLLRALRIREQALQREAKRLSHHFSPLAGR